MPFLRSSFPGRRWSSPLLLAGLLHVACSESTPPAGPIVQPEVLYLERFTLPDSTPPEGWSRIADPDLPGTLAVRDSAFWHSSPGASWYFYAGSEFDVAVYQTDIYVPDSTSITAAMGWRFSDPALATGSGLLGRIASTDSVGIFSLSVQAFIWQGAIQDGESTALADTTLSLNPGWHTLIIQDAGAEASVFVLREEGNVIVSFPSEIGDQGRVSLQSLESEPAAAFDNVQVTDVPF